MFGFFLFSIKYYLPSSRSGIKNDLGNWSLVSGHLFLVPCRWKLDSRCWMLDEKQSKASDGYLYHKPVVSCQMPATKKRN